MWERIQLEETPRRAPKNGVWGPHAGFMYIYIYIYVCICIYKRQSNNSE